MSIASEIERLQNAKSSIKTAIENKGIEVGEGTIDTYASKIDEMNNLNFKITSMYNLFYQGHRLDVYDELMSLVDDVTNMNGAFNRCSMTSIDLSNKNLENCSDYTNAFSYCTKLTDIKFPKQEIIKAVSFTSCFNQCNTLKDLDLSMFNCEKVTSVQSTFSACTSLTNFKSFRNLGKGFTSTSKNYYGYTLNFSNSTILTKNSLLDIINNLYDLNLTYNVANGGTLATQSLQIGSTNKAKLTSAEIAIATNKGWTVS